MKDGEYPELFHSLDFRPTIAVNAKDGGEITALLAAALEHQIGMVEFLLAAGADLKAIDSDGLTPLMGAAATGDTAIVKVLLDKGADPDAADKTGRTAWNHAVRNGHSDTATILETLSIKK